MADNGGDGKFDRRPAERMMRALRVPGLKPNEKTVLMTLAYRDGPEGAWPSYDQIAIDTGLRRSAVGKAIKGLREKRRLSSTKVRRERSFVNIYTLHIHSPGKEDGEIHRPETPDGEARSQSGNSAIHSPETPDPNRKKQESASMRRISLPDDGGYCPEPACGAPLPDTCRICPRCGTERQRCPVCGKIGVLYGHAQECRGAP